MKKIAIQKMIDLALEAGIQDRSYDTPRQGYVASYLGEAIIKFNGEYFLAIGHDTDGDPMNVTQEGYIEFIKIFHHEYSQLSPGAKARVDDYIDSFLMKDNNYWETSPQFEVYFDENKIPRWITAWGILEDGSFFQTCAYKRSLLLYL